MTARFTRNRAASGVLFFLAVLTLAPVLAFSFEGRLVEEDGAPVSFATVSIAGRSGSVTTDAQGHFQLTPDPPVPFLVQIMTSNGAMMMSSRVDKLPEGAPLVITVRTLMVAEDVVTSTAAPHTAAPPSAATSRVSSSEIAARSPANLAESLEQVPGTEVKGGGYSAVPSLRGMARGRTLLLLDSARVTTERRAGPSASFLDPFFLESLEVLRGPGAVAHGSGALGGVIHARTRRPMPGQDLQVRYRAAAGSRGSGELNGGTEISFGFGEAGVLLALRARTFDDYYSPEGRVPDSGARDRGALVRFVHASEIGLFTFGWQGDLGRDIGKPDSRSPERHSLYPEEKSSRFTAGFDFQPPRGWNRLSVEAFVDDYRLVFRRDQAGDAENTISTEISDVSAGDYGLHVTASRPLGLSDSHEGSLEMGLDINGRFGLEAFALLEERTLDDEIVSSISDQSIENASSFDGAVHGLAEYPALEGRLLTSVGLRADRYETSSTGDRTGDKSSSDNALTGFASLSWDLAEGLSVSGQVSRGFREPTLSDRYYVGPTGRGFVTGNPDLEPETSWQYDAGVRFTGDRMALSCFGFFYRIRDLIQREQEGDNFFFLNRDDSEIKGIEVEVSANVKDWLSARMTGQIMSGSDLDTGAALDDIPTASLGIGLFGKTGERIEWSVRWALADRDERPGPSEQLIPGYGTLDASASYRVFESLQIRLVGKNLTDQTYLTSSDDLAVLAPGRSATLVLEGTF